MAQEQEKTMPSEEVLMQAGRIASNFVLLEHGVAELTHLLLGSPRSLARSVTADLSFHAVRMLAATLAKERAPAHCAELKKLLQLVKRAEDRRDAVSCFLWGREIAGGKRRRERLLSRLRLDESGGLAVVELLDLAAEIAGLVQEVERLRASIRTEQGLRAAST